MDGGLQVEKERGDGSYSVCTDKKTSMQRIVIPVQVYIVYALRLSWYPRQLAVYGGRS